MSSRRARGTVPRCWFVAALFAALTIVPCNSVFAWTPPPSPLPAGPANTDGIDDDVNDDRPSIGHDSMSLESARESADGPTTNGSEEHVAWGDLGLKAIQLLQWLDRR